MLARRPEPMTVEAFLLWEQGQAERHELIDGVPVLRAIRKGWTRTTGMAGGMLLHGHTAANIVHALKSRLKGAPCRAYGSDVAVRTADQRTRYPDATVDCGPLGQALTAQEPRVVFEVLSPSNALADQLELLEDYQSIASVQHIAFLEQAQPSAVTWLRHEAGWRRDRLEGLDGVLELTALGFALPLAEVYDGAAFEAGNKGPS